MGKIFQFITAVLNIKKISIFPRLNASFSGGLNQGNFSVKNLKAGYSRYSKNQAKTGGCKKIRHEGKSVETKR